MTLESLIIWVIVGAITGIILDRAMGGMRIGLGGAILLGIVGAIISGWGLVSSELSWGRKPVAKKK